MTPSTEDTSTRKHPGPRARIHRETYDMSRYKDLALRLAVVVSFVLVLAAPFRW